MKIFRNLKEIVSGTSKENAQASTKKLIELATFFYKVDNRITLGEQRFVEELLVYMVWDGPQSAESFQSSCVLKINRVLEQAEEAIHEYVLTLIGEIGELGALSRAQAIAKDISEIDGVVSSEEAKYLQLVMSFG